MEHGAIPLSDIDGAFDLQATLESGQSYLWDRADGRMYESMGATVATHGTGQQSAAMGHRRSSASDARWNARMGIDSRRRSGPQATPSA